MKNAWNFDSVKSITQVKCKLIKLMESDISDLVVLITIPII